MPGRLFIDLVVVLVIEKKELVKPVANRIEDENEYEDDDEVDIPAVFGISYS